MVRVAAALSSRRATQPLEGPAARRRPALARPIAAADDANTPTPPPPAPPPTTIATQQATPLVAGLGVAAAALTARQLLAAYVRYAASPASRGFYRGGFQQEMTRREALLILGLRETAAQDAQRVRDAHRRIMLANHPDSGGSPYISVKVNEAKDMLLGKKRAGGSVF